jgi:hypothetical protein
MQVHLIGQRVVCYTEKDKQDTKPDDEKKPTKKAKELRVLDPKTAQNLCKLLFNLF